LIGVPVSTFPAAEIQNAKVDAPSTQLFGKPKHVDIERAQPVQSRNHQGVIALQETQRLAKRGLARTRPLTSAVGIKVKSLPNLPPLQHAGQMESRLVPTLPPTQISGSSLLPPLSGGTNDSESIMHAYQ
jgi:hypothetical protein